MTTYNSYEAAKIANPESEIYWVGKLTISGMDDVFGTKASLAGITSNHFKFNPADRCMTVEKFLADGHKFVGGDICLDHGSVQNLVDDFEIESFNEKCKLDVNRYILRAAALEEKSSEKVEWVNGDECRYMNSSEVHRFIGVDPTRNDFCYIKANCSAVNWVEVAKLSKPETKQQREDRERIEAAYDLLCIGNRALNVTAPCTLAEFKLDKPQRDFWLAIVDKTNYRKEV